MKSKQKKRKKKRETTHFEVISPVLYYFLLTQYAPFPLMANEFFTSFHLVSAPVVVSTR
jgi:hypothetical protein